MQTANCETHPEFQISNIFLNTNQITRCSFQQAESDASSEMSDNALHKLVSRLVEAGGDLGEDEAENVGATYAR